MKKITWMNIIDAKMKALGPKHALVWQMLKYLAVCGVVFVVQLVLLQVLDKVLENWHEPLKGFLAMIFSERTIGQGNSTWGFLFPFLASNIIASIIGYLINKNVTFNSDAPLWHLIVYLTYILFQIGFSTWLQGVNVNWMESIGNPFLSKYANLISIMELGFVQTIMGYPIMKFILLRDKEMRALKKMYKKQLFSEDKGIHNTL